MFVDLSYYTDVFKGKEDVDEKIMELACVYVDNLCYNRINAYGLDNMHAYIKDSIQKAVCYQAEYFLENGIEVSSMSSFSLPGMNVTFNGQSHSPDNVSSIAWQYIKRTGLRHRGIW